MIDPNELERTSGWGIRGCLFGAVAIFVILLVAMLVLAVIRFGERPRSAPQVTGYRLQVTERCSMPWRPTCDPAHEERQGLREFAAMPR